MSMQRSIKRNIEKNQGTFIAQKPLRDRSHRTFKEMLLEAVMKNRRVKSLMKGEA